MPKIRHIATGKVTIVTQEIYDVLIEYGKFEAYKEE